MKYANTIISALLGAVLVVSTSTAAATPTVAAKPTVISEARDHLQVTTTKPKKKWQCKNALARRLHSAGFRGDNLRQAWAIAMRESGGNSKSISSTGDYGVFQFNRAAHHKQSWWNSQRLLTSDYNMSVAYRMSKGGRTWYMWDIGGKGQHLGRYSSSHTYRVFTNWYVKYPCVAR